MLIDRISVLEKELASMVHPKSGIQAYKIRMQAEYASSAEFREYAEKWLSIFNELESARAEVALLTDFLSRNYLKMQSNMPDGYQNDGIVSSEVMERHENVLEVGGAETKMIEPENVPNLTFIKTDVDLDKFFSRPIEIADVSIATGASIENRYDVFSLYLANPAVRAKLRNFAYMRGKICVRISISGTPFDYGRMLVAAYPWLSVNDAFNAVCDPLAPWNGLKLAYISQAKISKNMDLKENKPVDIEMPWISPCPVGRLYNSATGTITSATNFNDFVGMWTLVVKTLNPRANVSATPSSVNMYIQAYMKDVEIGIPTGTLMDITTQSDERKIGPVENIASNALVVSKAAEKVPFLSFYAKASTMFLSGLKSVAAHMGWSAPVLITQPNRMKNEPFQNGSNLIQFDTGQRITLDPKQELAISTEYAATNKDELVISDLCKRSSLITTTTWTHNAPSMTPFLKLVVHPRIGPSYFGVTKANYVPSPMGMVATLFEQWHGKIVFTFEVVASNFHRGKLLIIFEPNIRSYTAIGAALDLNKQFAQVWDIQETQRFSVCVDWNFHSQWANNVSDTYIDQLINPTADITFFDEAANGMLFICPLTTLQSPDDSDIPINVYVHGEDMHFNRLTPAYTPVDRQLQYNSRERTFISEQERNTAIEPETCITINPASVATEGREQHFYGESPVSLRALMKRFAYNTKYYGATINAGQRMRISDRIYPKNFANVGTVGSGGGNNVYNAIRQAFLAMRGSIRHRFNLLSDSNLLSSPVFCSLDIGGADAPTIAIGTVADTMTMNGTAMFVPQTNCGIEVEMPFYYNRYFIFACAADPFYATGIYPVTGAKATRQYYIDVCAGGNITNLTVLDSIATGEDFQLSYFLGGVPWCRTLP